MRGLVAAELLKFRTTRGWIGFVGVLVILSAIGAVGIAESGRRFEIADPEFQRDLISRSVTAPLRVLVFILGIVAITGEWRHGTITRSLLVEPRRVRVLVAKGIAVSGFGAAFAVLAVLVALTAAIPIVVNAGESFQLDAELADRLGRIVLAAALWGALGLGFGALVKSQTFAIAAGLVWVLVVENILGGLFGLADWESVVELLPGHALAALDGSFADGLLPLLGGLVGLAYVALFGALGYVRLARADVT